MEDQVASFSTTSAAPGAGGQTGQQLGVSCGKAKVCQVVPENPLKRGVGGGGRIHRLAGEELEPKPSVVVVLLLRQILADDADLQSGFLPAFAYRGLGGGFPRLDASARKLPQTRQRLPFRTPAD